MPLSKLLLAGLGVGLTSFFSSAFAVFLPLSVIIYSVTPKRGKKYCLLLLSLLFFWLISGTLVLYLLASAFSIHYFGLWLDRVQIEMKDELLKTEKEERKIRKKQYLNKQRHIVCLAVILHIGTLLLLKYSGFFSVNLNAVLSFLHSPIRIAIPKFLLPIGISFFSLQALSYILDVYHGVIRADDNLGRLLLFLSFFPQIVEGPICRYSQTADALWNVQPITYHNLTYGSQRILLGLLKKVVIADRLNPFVDYVFTGYDECEGGIIALAAVCYTVQLYMDFSGAMDAMIGTAQIFGIQMPENFERPFFSKTISEFWKRWHITLGAWFRDYLFYPVTSSEKMKKLTSSARKKIGNHYGPLLAGGIALLCVWLCNGLWHGSGWNYVFFGFYHFILILTGSIIAPVVKKVNQKLHISSDWKIYRLLQILRTCILVFIGELFFRADGLQNGLKMFRKMITDFSFSSLNSAFLVTCRTDLLDFAVVLVTVIILFTLSAANEKGISVRNYLARQNIFVRWGVIYGLIMYIVVFGAYGYGYAPVDPLYAQF